MTRKPERLSDLKAAPYNPREISADALEGLKASLEEFGDISGIVWNCRTGRLVTGHQRLTGLRERHGPELRLDPERCAVVTPDGEAFGVRVVDWPEAKEKAANVAANSPALAGEFAPGLAPLLEELTLEMPETFAALRLGELAEAVPDFSPADEDSQARLDRKNPVTCPYCGKEFVPK